MVCTVVHEGPIPLVDMDHRPPCAVPWKHDVAVGQVIQVEVSVGVDERGASVLLPGVSVNGMYPVPPPGGNWFGPTVYLTGPAAVQSTRATRGWAYFCPTWADWPEPETAVTVIVPPGQRVVGGVGVPALLVRAKLAGDAPATPAVAVHVPAVLLAVTAGLVAVPVGPVVTCAVSLPPGKVPDAPVPGNVKVTVSPTSGAPLAHLAVAASGSVKAAPVDAVWPDPEAAAMAGSHPVVARVHR